MGLLGAALQHTQQLRARWTRNQRCYRSSEALCFQWDFPPSLIYAKVGLGRICGFMGARHSLLWLWWSSRSQTGSETSAIWFDFLSLANTAVVEISSAANVLQSAPKVALWCHGQCEQLTEYVNISMLSMTMSAEAAAAVKCQLLGHFPWIHFPCVMCGESRCEFIILTAGHSSPSCSVHNHY